MHLLNARLYCSGFRQGDLHASVHWAMLPLYGRNLFAWWFDFLTSPEVELPEQKGSAWFLTIRVSCPGATMPDQCICIKRRTLWLQFDWSPKHTWAAYFSRSLSILAVQRYSHLTLNYSAYSSEHVLWRIICSVPDFHCMFSGARHLKWASTLSLLCYHNILVSCRQKNLSRLTFSYLAQSFFPLSSFLLLFEINTTSQFTPCLESP